MVQHVLIFLAFLCSVWLSMSIYLFINEDSIGKVRYIYWYVFQLLLSFNAVIEWVLAFTSLGEKFSPWCWDCKVTSMVGPACGLLRLAPQWGSKLLKHHLGLEIALMFAVLLLLFTNLCSIKEWNYKLYFCYHTMTKSWNTI